MLQVYASRIASTEADAGLYNVPRVQLLAFTRMPVLATATHQTVGQAEWISMGRGHKGRGHRGRGNTIMYWRSLRVSVYVCVSMCLSVLYSGCVFMVSAYVWCSTRVLHCEHVTVSECGVLRCVHCEYVRV